MENKTPRPRLCGWLLGAVFLLAVVLAPGPAAAQSLYVDTGDSNSPYSMTTDLNIYPNEYIGTSSSGGVFNQGNSGTYTNTVTTGLVVGGNSGSTGTYNLSGGTLTGGTGTPSGYETIGGSGSGTFNQTGGVNTIADNNLNLGLNPGSSGTYNLSAGSLTVSGSSSTSDGYLNVGNSGDGSFVQSGGTNAVTNNINLANASAASGAYDLSSGSLSAAAELIGLNGSGSFTQSGGTNSTSSGDVVLGRFAGASGTYDFTGGSLSVAGNQFSGSTGSGSFTNSGGTDTVTGNLYVGFATNSSGSYTLSGAGVLSASYEEIGGSGTGVFSQNGGTNSTTTDDLSLGRYAGGNGAYNLTGGSLSVAGNEFSGSQGTGNFTNSGGTDTVAGYLSVGTASGSTGNYTLSGPGSLAVSGFEYVGNTGSGSFIQTGGTNAAAGDLYLGNNSRSSGTYNLSGSGSLSAADEYVGGAGSGAFTQSGGTNTTDYLYLGDVGGSGGASGTYNLSGSGSLAVTTNEFIGTSGSGSFTQSGGTHTVTGILYLGFNSGSSGSYNLSTGLLDTADEYVGNSGSGSFTQSGGTNTTANLYVGYSSGSGDSYTLGGGSLTAGTIALAPGGAFSMTGGTLSATTFNGNLTNGGTVVPRGDAPGTLTVNGNYTQTASGTLVEQIASAGSYSKLVVTGSASLNGALDIELQGGYIPSYGTSFPGILTATSGSGTFSSIINQYITPTLYWNVLYGDYSVGLQTVNGATVARNYTSPSLNLTHNQYAVGNMLNGVANSATGDLNTVLTAIDSLTSNSGVANALQQISPEKAAALPTLAFAGANMQKSVLSRRITDLRFGPGDAALAAGGLGAFSLNYAQGSGLMVASSASSLTGLLSGQKDPGALDKPWGVYFDPGLILGSQASSVDQTGFGFTMAGFTAGADYRVQQDLLLGLNTGYTYTSAGFRGSGGYVQGNTWPLNAYAAYLPKPFYAYGSLGYALNLFNLERDFNFDGLSRAAKSSSTGNQLNAYGETGYDLRLNPVVLTPAVTLAYSKLWLDGFTENGAGALDLTVGPQNAQSLQTGVGGKIAVPLQRDSVTVTPQAYAFYQHEYSDSSRTLDARLTQGGAPFTYLTDDFTGAPHRNFAVLGADVTIATKKNLKVQLDYNAEVGRGNYTAHYVSAGLRWEF